MRRRRPLVAAAVLLPILAVMALAAFVILRLNTRTYPPAVPSGDLAFTTRAGGQWDIALYSADGGVSVLTPADGFHDYFASWDFAGERINFLANRAPDGELAPTQIQPDGSGLRVLDILSAIGTLVFEGRLDWDPAYARRGALVWASLRDLNLELYARDAEAAEPRRLTETGARDWFAVWSPDGAYIAFASDRDGDENVYVMRADGNGLTAVTGDGADDIHPFWSLDGAQLAFVSERDGELKDGILTIYVVDVEAALAGNAEQTTRPLPLDAPFEGGARYSADGRQVALTAREGGRWVVRVMDVDETGELIRDSVQTISADGDSLFPVWRP